MNDNALMPAVPLETELTMRQQAFINHPLANIDPKQAMIDVGYSQSYAERNAWTLRKEMDYFIRQKAHQVAAWINVDAMAVLQQIGAIATSDITQYFEYVDTADGSKLVPRENLKAMPERLRAAIKKIEFDTVVTADGKAITFVSKLELHDKLGALKTLAEIHGIADGKKPAANTALLKGLSVDQLQRLEDVMTDITTEVRQANSQRRDEDAIDVKPE